ncbi:hypothetical protein C8R44DRAFT_736998 [Mycena epipterygia]|nr:hypothetical protein C8R44DRAFT_736998 [Mycena epipterygia]
MATFDSDEWLSKGKRWEDTPGTASFAHLLANSCLALLPKEETVNTFHSHIEIGPRAHTMFQEISAETVLLAKAVASLNTVQRKGKANIHIMELPEDEAKQPVAHHGIKPTHVGECVCVFRLKREHPIQQLSSGITHNGLHGFLDELDSPGHDQCPTPYSNNKEKYPKLSALPSSY